MAWYDNYGITANIKEGLENTLASDPTDSSADSSEIQIRKSYSFANLRFTFPVTDPKTLLTFPAYITNLSDSFSPRWNPQTVFGRSDPIAIYQGTSRNISLGFAIPCFDSTDANFTVGKLNRLIQNLYPSYETFGGTGNYEGNRVIAGAPLTRVRFANLITNTNSPGSGLLGFITNLSVQVSPNNGFFIESGLLSMGALFPRVVEFSFSFTPLHEETVGWVAGKNGAWFGRSQNFPYDTKTRIGDIVTATAGMFGLGQNLEFGKLFGLGEWSGD